MPAALAMILAGAAGASLGLWLSTKVRTRVVRHRHARVQENERIRAAAERERQTLRVQAEVAAREEALVVRADAEAAFRARQLELAELEAALVGRTVLAGEEARELEVFRQELAERESPLRETENRRRALAGETESLRKQYRSDLERAAGTTARQLLHTLREAEIEEARALAAQAVRGAGEGGSAPETARAAKRLMGISVGRITNHFYSERAQSLVPLPESRGGPPPISADDLRLVEGVSGVTLVLSEAGDGIRLEGQDGVGREIARRCLAHMLKRPGLRGDAFARMAREITSGLEREIVEFGRRGFALLKLDRAHPEIVKLLGRLNYRTSYSQNQWEHAVEAGFLCGMIAAELGLDVKIARRAALLHDIGKALTHALDGSHATIGADHARRLGESEIIANAIGAHHTDEPFASAYAHLVAAADAMSGGRPGARRQSEDNHTARLAEIERIVRNFRGVGEAFAVQGGREVRVYVEEGQIGDAGAAKLAADIAQAISRELTFPGQIKVIVIREFKAVELAS